MTDLKEQPRWLTYYHRQLDLRNQSQSQAFYDLIKNYSEVMSKYKSLDEQYRSLEREKLVSKSLL